MSIKISHFVSFIILGSLLTACGGNKAKTSPNTQPNFTETRLNNEGSICLYTKKNNDINVYYFPRNSSCSSSSANRWSNQKLTVNSAFRKSLKDSLIEIEASTTHRLNHSGIATADCAGAGIQSKLLPLNGSHRFEVYWGGHKVGDYSNSKGTLMCKKMNKAGVVSAAPQHLQDYVRRVAPLF